jgi:hypothetical protein
VNPPRLTNAPSARAGTHYVGYASCSCGWSCSRPTETQAQAAAQVHAIRHGVSGQRVALPVRPLRLGAWSTREAV